ncbi:MAG: chitobiase/beta-hexosaminidase C-terminal domain-containing protein [Bacteroidetes bacterium]|nr:chitobiase/beta-hexosaminidase C-terminal domain-containing protein [Bacteroidota bacterium]
MQLNTNSNDVMETETISKNRVSLKSLTSRGIFLISFAISVLTTQSIVAQNEPCMENESVRGLMKVAPRLRYHDEIDKKEIFAVYKKDENEPKTLKEQQVLSYFYKYNSLEPGRFVSIATGLADEWLKIVTTDGPRHIYYTTDGSEPTINSKRTEYFKQAYASFGKATEGTLKIAVIDDCGNKSPTQTYYLKFADFQETLDKVYRAFEKEQRMIDSVAQDILKTPNLTDFDKIYKAYQWVTNTFRIDHLMEGGDLKEYEKTSGTIFLVHPSLYFDISEKNCLKIPMMHENSGVCRNFASVFSQLLDKLGIENNVLRSTEKNICINRDVQHAWNQVKLNGKWYHCDAMWDSSPYYNNFGYFLIGDEKRKPDFPRWVVDCSHFCCQDKTGRNNYSEAFPCPEDFDLGEYRNKNYDPNKKVR